MVVFQWEINAPWALPTPPIRSSVLLSARSSCSRARRARALEGSRCSDWTSGVATGWCCGPTDRGRRRRWIASPGWSRRRHPRIADPTGPLRGVGASPGVGVGPVVRLADRLPEPPGDAPADDPVAAWAQASDALAAVAADLEERGRRAGPEARAVLEAQALMARDPDLATEVARNSGTGADLQVMAPMVRSLRDVGVDLGMSHQRAHQLVSS